MHRRLAPETLLPQSSGLGRYSVAHVGPEKLVGVGESDSD